MRKEISSSELGFYRFISPLPMAVRVLKSNKNNHRVIILVNSHCLPMQGIKRRGSFPGSGESPEGGTSSPPIFLYKTDMDKKVLESDPWSHKESDIFKET